MKYLPELITFGFTCYIVGAIAGVQACLLYVQKRENRG